MSLVIFAISDFYCDHSSVNTTKPFVFSITWSYIFLDLGDGKIYKENDVYEHTIN